MSIDTWAIIASIALFSLGNGGLFLYKFGSLETEVKENKAWLGRLDDRVTRHLEGRRQKAEVEA